MPDVVLPSLGESVTEGMVTKRFKSVGDRVEPAAQGGDRDPGLGADANVLRHAQRLAELNMLKAPAEPEARARAAAALARVYLRSHLPGPLRRGAGHLVLLWW